MVFFARFTSACRKFNKGSPLEVSSLRLDAYTLVFSIAMLASFMAAVSFSLGRGISKPRCGLNEWGISMACFAGAFLLFFFLGHGPWLLTFLVANIMVMVALPYGILAHARLFEIAPPRLAIACTTALGLAGVLSVYFFDTSRAVSIFAVSLGLALQLGLLAGMIWQNIGKTSATFAWASGLVMVLLAIAFALRAMLAIFGDVSAVVVVANSTSQIATLLMGGIVIAVTSNGFFAMVNEKQQRETFDRLRRDGLTGLFTRSAFFEMAQEIDAIGQAEGYAIVFIDIDNFKATNDTYGHAGGDVTLAHAARLISSSIRLSDIAVRYGGEEFCILLRACTEPEAAKFAEALVSKAALQSVRLLDGRSTQFTISAGYACMPCAGKKAPEDLERIIERADQALYRAKGEGRNRALAASPSTSALPAACTPPPLLQAREPVHLG